MVKFPNLNELKTNAITAAGGVLKVGFAVAGRAGVRKSQKWRLADLPDSARVVIIKPCCLGDVLLATATVRALSEARPDLQLEFLVSDWARAALTENPRLTRVMATGVEGSDFTPSEFGALVKKLQEEKYAAAIVLDRSPRLNLLPFLAKIPRSAGLDSSHRGFALDVRAPVSAVLKHEAEVYLDVARALGVEPQNPRTEFIPSHTDSLKYKQKASQLGITRARPLAVIHPGGGHNPDTKVLSKRWLPENFGQIAARLANNGYQVVVIGAQTDRTLAETVVATANDLNVVNACEAFNLGETGALLSQTRLFVGNDTGIMHLAVACGAAVVAVYGPSSPVSYAPYTAKGRTVAPVAPTVQAGLPLKEYERLSAAEGGIASVTVEAVWEKIIQLVEIKSDDKS
jgi:lipopolysaccharide heptosyltransferase II